MLEQRMINMIKPKQLKQGDTIAIVSPSSGLAGEPHIRWRTEQGIRFIENMGYRVKVMPNTLNGLQWNYDHPEARAKSLMAAFQDDEVKAIVCTIGGYESVRIIPYLEPTVIQQHPKIFIGYSDITVLHVYFNQLGLTTFYGPALLTDFAENGGADPYTMTSLFSLISECLPYGELKPVPYYRKYGLKWEEHLRHFERDKIPAHEFEVLQGHGSVSGPLVGGCFESLDKLRGTTYFPALETFDEAVLFIETSEVHSSPWSFEESIRTWGLMGILNCINALIIGRPHDGVFQNEYHASILKVLKEFQADDLIVIGHVPIGHNEPKATLPMGAIVTLQTQPCKIVINTSAVSQI